METIAFTNTNEIFDALESLNGSSLIAINGYKNMKGKVSNVILNVLFDQDLAKRNDLMVIENMSHTQLETISKETGVDMEVVLKAHTELLTSMEKNISGENTKASLAQINTYTHFTDGVKIHNMTGEIYIFGLLHSEEVLVKGEYKKVNKQKKTIAKDAIKKACNFEMAKYRTYKIESMDAINVEGVEINMK